MPRILVIADDLTGAADCAVAFAVHGLHTVVVLSDCDEVSSAEVLSIDADTRRLPPDQAALETTRLLRKYLCDDETILYKKLDSTMRGNIGEELAAALHVRRNLSPASAPAVAILAPAFPATGRTTLNGLQFLNGEPLTGHLAGRATHAHGRSDIAAILRASGLRSVLLGLQQVRGSADDLRRTIQTIAQKADVLVCDAQSEDDLHRIAQASIVLGHGAVWAGSGGLARHLPLALGLPHEPKPLQPATPYMGPTLYVVGSGSAISRQQVEALIAGTDTIAVRIPADLLVNAPESPSASSTLKLELEHALSSGRDVALTPDSGLRPNYEAQPMIAIGLAALVAPFAHKVGALVATGGETARAVFGAWGIARLRLLGEVESGLPFSVTSGWTRELPVITKAGAFGSVESLLRCRQFLRQLQSNGNENQDQVKGHA